MKKALLVPFFFLIFISLKAQTTAQSTSPVTDTAKADTGKTFFRVEQVPEFPGGIEAFMKFINHNLKYPQTAKNDNIQGKVFVSFVVEKDGSLTDIKVMRSVSPELDAEAVRLIKSSPKWKPGIQGGRPVRVSYSVPIIFSLDN